MQNNKLIHEFQKNALEKVRIELGSFMNKNVINIRVYYKANETENEWRPSPKGITMVADLIPELLKGINEAYKKWHSQINTF